MAVKEPHFPEDWIIPGEFSFGSSGHHDTLRVGPPHHDSQKPSEDSVRAVHLFRNLLAQERKRRGLPPKFWAIDKPKDKMTKEEWTEWLRNKFPPYYIDYKQVPK